ncbi:hypothetical protein [Mesobacillus jeotgali]|jgi:hypothetical protein|uniref:Uncharacterized protein n=1 Tax=Mesobacillus jeotgali TaxID=129985 RepID=A0ABY9VKJ5_9BACI|nr:hypothetical protein [Mesobacillus jeotgali]WNF24165.1 hypothetical protein RH061_06695 [Mesobacillus jeotgali]
MEQEQKSPSSNDWTVSKKNASARRVRKKRGCGCGKKKKQSS